MAGVSAAAELAGHARVLLIETESQPGYHATGRSAAILAQTYGSGPVRDLTAASARFFDKPPDGFVDAPLLSPRGLMLIARDDQMDGLRAMHSELSVSGYLSLIDAAEVEDRAPILRKGYAAGGIFNPHAQDIDVHGLLQGYLRLFRARGGEVTTRAEVTRLTRDGNTWTITTGTDTYQAGTIVNAAGAWADQVADRAGVQPIGLAPLRRSALTFSPPDGLDTDALPMLVDAEEQFYLKPETGKLLASPANEDPSAPCDSQPDEMDIAIAIDRVLTAFDLDVRRIEAKWAGLRTFAPDRAPVCGHDPQAEGFFWLAGQGGYGIQTAPALARLTAHLITGAAPDPDFLATGLPIDTLSPARFHRAAAK